MNLRNGGNYLPNSGIESRWGPDFPPIQTGPGAHPASCKMGTGSIPGVKFDQGVLLTTHPLLVPQSWKSTAIPLPTLWATPSLEWEYLIFFIYQTTVIIHQKRVKFSHYRPGQAQKVPGG